jgi:hypothetical protein
VQTSPARASSHASRAGCRTGDGLGPLLIWRGLFLRSLDRINDVNPGFDPTGVLLAGIELARNAGEPAERILVELRQRIADLAAVESAGLAKIVPLAMAGREEFDVSIADHTPDTPRALSRTG